MSGGTVWREAGDVPLSQLFRAPEAPKPKRHSEALLPRKRSAATQQPQPQPPPQQQQQQQQQEEDEEEVEGPVRKRAHVESGRDGTGRDTPERLLRTVHVSNVPVGIRERQLRHLFTPHGKVESIRLRGFAFDAAKANKKRALLAKDVDLHSSRDTCLAYVVMGTAEEAKKAVEAQNGVVFHDKHLFMDVAAFAESKYSHRQSVFLGSLPLDASEEDVYNLFKSAGPIRRVRLVRDSVTGVGKGIGFVLFEDRESAGTALQLDGELLGGRKIRVTKTFRKSKESVASRDAHKKKSRNKQVSASRDGDAEAHGSGASSAAYYKRKGKPMPTFSLNPEKQKVRQQEKAKELAAKQEAKKEKRRIARMQAAASSKSPNKAGKGSGVSKSRPFQGVASKEGQVPRQVRVKKGAESAKKRTPEQVARRLAKKMQRRQQRVSERKKLGSGTGAKE